MRLRALSEAWDALAILAGLFLAAVGPFRKARLPIAALFAFTLYFFRDPERAVPADASLVVAPADGKVVEIAEVDEREVLHRRMKRISIFLSILDVHVNRSPIGGRVAYCKETPGEFLDARNPASSSRNQARTWVIEGSEAEVMVRQITGAVARRIVAWARVGQDLRRGERFGMIRFGSRTELYLPLEAEVLVSVGQTVRGASTPVARL